MFESLKKPALIFICFALTASTLLVFWQVRNFDFVNYDDNIYVYENPEITKGLSCGGIIRAFATSYFGYWQPLTWLSLMLDCQLFGINPGRMHLVNVFLHLANTLLLFAVLRKMSGSLWPSAFVAAAFALHPMHVESVVWISERKDVLSTLFMMLTLAAYAGHVKRPSAFKYIISLIIFALGLMAKPMLVTLPFILLLLDYWPLDRFAAPRIVKTAAVSEGRAIWYRILIEKIPFFALAAASSVITFLTQQTVSTIVNFKTIPCKDRLSNALLSYAAYMGKIFWPRDLAIFYPFDAGHFTLGKAAIYVVLLLGISIFVIRFGRERKYLPVGWFWFVGTLIPVIGLVRFTESSYADRFTYIPYIGLFIIIAWGLPDLVSKLPGRKLILGISGVIALTALGIVARQQTSYWNNSIALFSHAIEVTKNNFLAHNNLGAAYSNLGRWQEAIEACKQAIRLKPDYAKAYNNLGAAYRNLGRWQEAIEAYRQAIRLKPDYTGAHYNLCIAYGHLGRWQEAIEACKQAIQIKPDYAEAHYNLGVAYRHLGRWQEAIEACKQAIRIKPDYTEAHNNLGNAYANLGRWQEAIDAYGQAIQLKPDYTEAHYNLGNAYANLGRWQEAIDHARRTCELTHYRNAAFLDTLATAYLSAGRFPEAAKTAQAALEINPNLANAHKVLGTVLSLEGSFEKSIVHLKRSLEIKPGNIGVKNKLAWMLAVCPDPAVRNPSEAIRLAQETCTATNSMDPGLLDTLGAAYASAGRFAEAIDTADRALNLAEAANEPEIKSAIERHLIFYKQNQPYIESAK